MTLPSHFTVCPLVCISKLVSDIVVGCSFGLFNKYTPTAFSTALPYASILLSFAFSLAFFIIPITSGIVIKASIASTTNTASNSINVNPFFLHKSLLKIYL